jgi:nucleolar protein 14
MEKEQEENIRHQLDNDFSAVLSLMHGSDSFRAGSNIPEGSQKAAGANAMVSSLAPEVQDTDYDQHVRELAFDKRSKPKDRTKTEEELALEQKKSLEKAERQRRKRMLGLEDSESEDERKSGKRKRGGDDLEDDFHEEENNMDWAGLGAGLDVKPRESESESEEGNDESDEVSEEEAEGDEQYTSSEEGENEEGEQELLTTDIPRGKKRVSSAAGELPYTFSAPASHEEFLEIIEDIEDKDIPVVIQRIRTLYHTSLAPDNKLKLQVSASQVRHYELCANAGKDASWCPD